MEQHIFPNNEFSGKKFNSIAVPGLKVFLRGIRYFFARFISEYVQVRSYRSTHNLSSVAKKFSAVHNYARSRNALITFKEMFHAAVFLLVPLRLLPYRNVWLNERLTVLLSSSTTSYISRVSLIVKITTSVSTVREEYSAMPRFHGSSVWFFLIEQRETDMAIATDVDSDD